MRVTVPPCCAPSISGAGPCASAFFSTGLALTLKASAFLASSPPPPPHAASTSSDALAARAKGLLSLIFSSLSFGVVVTSEHRGQRLEAPSAGSSGRGRRGSRHRAG